PRRGSGRRGAGAARPCSRERDEVRGRRDADDVRYLLVNGGSRRPLARLRRLAARRARLRRPLVGPARASAPPRAPFCAAHRRGMSRLVAFGRFWWDFVIGDEWVVAALVALGIGATAALAAADVAAWWL